MDVEGAAADQASRRTCERDRELYRGRLAADLEGSTDAVAIIFGGAAFDDRRAKACDRMGLRIEKGLAPHLAGKRFGLPRQRRRVDLDMQRNHLTLESGGGRSHARKGEVVFAGGLAHPQHHARRIWNRREFDGGLGRGRMARFRGSGRAVADGGVEPAAHKHSGGKQGR